MDEGTATARGARPGGTGVHRPDTEYPDTGGTRRGDEGTTRKAGRESISHAAYLGHPR